MSTPNHPSPVTFSNVFIHSIQWSHQDAPVVVRLLRKTEAGDTYDTAQVVLPPDEARRVVPYAMFTRLKLVIERFNPARKFAARPGLTCVVGRVTNMDSANGALSLQDIDWEPGEAFRAHRLFGCHELNAAGFELNDEVLIWFVPDSDEKPVASDELTLEFGSTDDEEDQEIEPIPGRPMCVLQLNFAGIDAERGAKFCVLGTSFSTPPGPVEPEELHRHDESGFDAAIARLRSMLDEIEDSYKRGETRAAPEPN